MAESTDSGLDWYLWLRAEAIADGRHDFVHLVDGWIDEHRKWRTRKGRLLSGFQGLVNRLINRLMT